MHCTRSIDKGSRRFIEHTPIAKARKFIANQHLRTFVLGNLDLGSHTASVPLGVEDGRGTNTALTGKHPPPGFLARRAQRGDEPNAGDGDSRHLLRPES